MKNLIFFNQIKCKKGLWKWRKSIVRIQNISKTYQAENGEVEALKGINFDVKEGEFISIIGPSGCGKSTLLSIISGLESKTNGEVYIDGKVGYMLQKIIF